MGKSRIFSSGSRRDSAEGKPPLSKLPGAALEKVAEIHGYGDAHYGQGNWRKGQPISVLADSLRRHYEAVMRGENLDPGSGLPHVAHMAWNALVMVHQLAAYPDQYAHLDDRMDDFGGWVNRAFAHSEEAELRADPAKREQDAQTNTPIAELPYVPEGRDENIASDGTRYTDAIWEWVDTEDCEKCDMADKCDIRPIIEKAKRIRAKARQVS